MSTTDSQYANDLRQFDRACDDFERAFDQGNSPRIEDYLEKVDPSFRRRLFQELFWLESDQVCRNGGHVDVGEALMRFPDYGDIVHDVLSQGSQQPVATQSNENGNDSNSIILESGTEIHQYVLIDSLGTGGMGRVFRAHDRKLNRTVAIKFMREEVLDNESALRRFRSEAATVASLQHDHIVRIYEVDEYEGRTFLVFEYVEGGSLNKWIDGRGQNPRTAATVARDIACAIEAAHQRGVIHRDLKPANILMTSAGGVKISDFGLAKRDETFHPKTVAGELLGTIAYMAPEQITSRKLIGPQTDVYGLGATLYEMLTGRPPFVEPNHWKLMKQVVHSEPVAPRMINPMIPVDLETICAKCLEKDPAQRYKSAANLESELQNFLDGRSIVARPGGVLDRIRKWHFRNRSLSTTILLATGLLVIAIAVGFYQVSQERNRFRSERDRAERNLVESLIQNANLQIESQPVGWWFAAKKNLEQAVALSDDSNIEDLRNTAIAWMGASNPCFRQTQIVDAGHPIDFLSLGNRDQWLATTGHGKVKIWNAKDISLVGQLSEQLEIRQCVLHPSSTILAVIDANQTVRMGELDATTLTATWKVLDIGAASILKFSPDGKYLVVGTDESEVHVVCPGVEYESRYVFALSGPAVDFAIDDLGTEVVVADKSMRLSRFDLRTGRKQAERMIGKVPTSISVGAARDSLGVPSLAFTAKDTFTLAMVSLTDFATLDVSRHLHHRTIAQLQRVGRNLIVTASLDGNICIFNTAFQRLAVADHDSQEVLNFAVGRNGGFLVAGLFGNQLARWEIHRSPFVIESDVNAPEFSWAGNGQSLLMASTAISVLDLNSRRLEPAVEQVVSAHLASTLPGQSTVEEPSNMIWDIDISSDGLLAGTAAHSGAIGVWNTEDWSQVHSAELEGLGWCVEFSPNNVFLAAGGDELKIVNVETGDSVELIGHTDLVNGLAFSSDSKYLFSCSRDGTVRAWDVAGGTSCEVILNSAVPVLSLSVHPDGQQMSVGLYNGEIATWRTKDRDLSATLNSKARSIEWEHLALHQTLVRAIGYSPNGSLLLSGSDRGRVIVQDARTLMVIGELKTGIGQIRDIEFSDDMQRLAIASYAKPTFVWDYPKLLDQLEKWDLSWPEIGGAERLPHPVD